MAQYDGMTNYIARRIGPPGLYVWPFIYFLLLFNGSRHIKLASDKSARLESVAGSALFFCPADDALNESVRNLTYRGYGRSFGFLFSLPAPLLYA